MIPDDAIINNEVFTPIFSTDSVNVIILANSRIQIINMVVIAIGNASVDHKISEETRMPIPMIICFSA